MNPQPIQNELLQENEDGYDYKLKKGDLVVMHTCMEATNPKYFGKIWLCTRDEFKHSGHDYGSIFLEGFSGSFSTEFLQPIKHGDILEAAGRLTASES